MPATPDNDRVDPEEKKRNLGEAARGIIASGRLRVPPWNKDNVEDLISDPPVLPLYEDSMPCNGQKCMTCPGCDSFRTVLAELREAANRTKEEASSGIDEQTLDAAEDAMNSEFEKATQQEISEDVPVFAGATGSITFSRWDILKFASRACEQAIKVDLINLKRRVTKEDYNVTIPKDKWETIRTFMILNGMTWWLDNIRAECTEEEEFRILHTHSQGMYYLEGRMKLIKSDDTGNVKYQSPTEYVNEQPPKIRNWLKAIQLAFNEELTQLARWTASFHH